MFESEKVPVKEAMELDIWKLSACQCRLTYPSNQVASVECLNDGGRTSIVNDAICATFIVL